MVLVDGAKLVKGDWDCKDFIWRRKRAEWPLLLPVAGKERSRASLDGPPWLTPTSGGVQRRRAFRWPARLDL